ncbi:hypothetical protein [Paenibacillus wynnii]|uniref:Uncharacterized protein n=1 Tax=Paenibacillus wynnii TaxID=268407 RepID=A0A098M6Z6_9BACL|nr:hypothetical protein [Paenibacillus wynnii]KGE18329.1 hypothetical protein PWYN_27845 [Paenibacillus wynnii]
MRLRELLTVVEANITLEISGLSEEYVTKKDIPEFRMNSEVNGLKAIENGLMIKLAEPKKVPTLEELGYSFEVGV